MNVDEITIIFMSTNINKSHILSLECVNCQIKKILIDAGDKPLLICQFIPYNINIMEIRKAQKYSKCEETPMYFSGK